jgi:hypothetical protein
MPFDLTESFEHVVDGKLANFMNCWKIFDWNSFTLWHNFVSLSSNVKILSFKCLGEEYLQISQLNDTKGFFWIVTTKSWWMFRQLRWYFLLQSSKSQIIGGVSPPIGLLHLKHLSAIFRRPGGFDGILTAVLLSELTRNDVVRILLFSCPLMLL